MRDFLRNAGLIEFDHYNTQFEVKSIGYIFKIRHFRQGFAPNFISCGCCWN